MPRLDGLVAVVTGGASGLGLAVVERFVAEGARVVVLDRSEDKLRAVGEAFGDAVVPVTGDATKYDDNQRAVDAALVGGGRLDAFIANAGIWDFAQSLEDTPPSALDSGFDELFAVNVKAAVFGAKAALTALRAARGSFVLTLSNSSFYPAGGGPLYVASKHAGVGLVKQLAYELAPDIRVNGVAPGGMPTDLRGPRALGLEDVSIEQAVPIRDFLAHATALQHVAMPEDYVASYVMLASRVESPTITGTVLDVSGFGIPPRNQSDEAPRESEEVLR